MNPANEIKKKANKLKKSYWEYLNDKGFIYAPLSDELDKLEVYKSKCQERRNNNDKTL